MRQKRTALFALALAVVSVTSAHAGGPNSNVRYFGYDWLDAYSNAPTALAVVNSTGPATTNLNVVHTLSELNSSACAAQKCALGISAGQYENVTPTHQRLDICPIDNHPKRLLVPAQLNHNDCVALNPWSKIWQIVSAISNSNQKPGAIYFIDEPSLQPALRNANDQYTSWTYASYVCTLRQALTAHHLSMPIFTILGMGELPKNGSSPNPDAEGFVTREVRNQMPISGCPSDIRSTPDWVGIDHYEWKFEVGGQNDVANVYNEYQAYFPSGGNMPKWILVPPSHKSLTASTNDQEYHKYVQVYWEVLAAYPTAPVIYMMAHRYDPNIMAAANPNDTSNPNNYWQTRGLLKYMGNMIVGP